MYNPPEQFTNANRVAVDTAMTLANTAFASAERIAALNLNAARSFLADSVENAQAVLAVKDLQDLANIPAALIRPALDKAIAYSRDLYEIGTESQAKLGEILEVQFAELNKNFTSALDKVAKSAPAGSEAAVAAVRSAIAAANSAYDSVAKATKQVAEIADANVAAAISPRLKTAGASVAKSKKAG